MRLGAFRSQLLLALIVLVCGYLLAWYGLDDARSDSRQRQQLYLELLQRSAIFNRDLPKLIDRHTRFERAEVVNNGMRFVYALVEVDRFVHDADALRQQIEPVLRQRYCEGESLRFYREQAQFVEYLYQDRQNLSLFQLRFTPEQCFSK